MAEGRVGFVQEALRGLMKCLGLESGGGKGAVSDEGESVNNPPPPQPTTYEPPSTTDPLVEALTSSIDKPLVSTRDIDIDEIMNSSGSTTTEANYVELVDNGKTNMTLLSTRLISSGGGGKNH